MSLPTVFCHKTLKQSIVNSIVTKSGKGGTYFGATGCGKTYTMAFLARQLSLRCTDIPEIGSPTIILIVDRDELQKQGSKLFTKSTEFLNIGEVSVVKNRTQLRQELGTRQVVDFIFALFRSFVIEKMIKLVLSMLDRILYVFQMKRIELSLNILRKFSLAKMQTQI